MKYKAKQVKQPKVGLQVTFSYKEVKALNKDLQWLVHNQTLNCITDELVDLIEDFIKQDGCLD